MTPLLWLVVALFLFPLLAQTVRRRSRRSKARGAATEREMTRGQLARQAEDEDEALRRRTIRALTAEDRALLEAMGWTAPGWLVAEERIPRAEAALRAAGATGDPDAVRAAQSGLDVALMLNAWGR